ncbi:MAG: hypothetical protein WA947_09985 [Phormidesmis sp.]
MVSPRTVGLCASLILLSGSLSVIAAPLSSREPVANANSSAGKAEIIIQEYVDSAFPQRLARRIQQDLIGRLNASPSSLQIVEATPQTWPDQCLGLARPFQRCRGGEIRGWQVQVAGPQQMWIYRSDRTGRRLALEPLPGTADFARGDFSAEVSQQLLKTAALQIGQPVSNLQVLEVQPAIWDGCLGIFEPDRACTKIAIAGFRTILSDGQTSWVYHLSEDGTQIAQNATASGASAQVVASFDPLDDLSNSEESLAEASPSEESLNAEQILPTQEEQPIIFQSQQSGDFAGSVQTTALLADGTLYHESQFMGRSPERAVLRQLSPAEIATFETALQQQRFPNLNRMRYLTSAAYADYPTTRLTSPGIGVSYIDLEQESLPESLRSVISLWQALIETEQTQAQ